MKILYIESDGYKPLTYSGIQNLKMTIEHTVNVFIGNNGSGKSALNRIVCPKPVSKGDFVKNGLFRVGIEHLGKKYELVADFSDPKRSFSFFNLTDGEELNVSGNSTIQAELAQTVMGYTPLIETICNGNLDVADMRKGDRKTFFLKAYPSDLTFILERHKKIASRIRELKGNLKMLTERSLKLKDKLMPDEQIEHLRSLNKEYEAGINGINAALHRLRQEKDELLNCDEYRRYTGPRSIDFDQFQREYKDFKSQLVRLWFNAPHVFDGRKPELIMTEAESEVRSLSQQLDELESRGVVVREELDQLEQYADSSIEEEMNELRIAIGRNTELLKSIQYDNTIPIVPFEDVIHLKEETLPLLTDLIAQLPGKVWSESTRTIVQRHLSHLSGRLGIIEEDIAGNGGLHEEVSRRVAALQGRSYPLTCNMTCTLKSERDGTLAEAIAIRDGYAEVIAELHEKKRRVEKCIKVLKNRSEGPNQAASFLREFKNQVAHQYWEKYILVGYDHIDALNNLGATITNRLKLVIENSIEHDKFTRANTELSRLITRFETIEAANIPAKEIISKTLIDKLTELRAITRNITKRTSDKRNSMAKHSDASFYAGLQEAALKRFKTMAAYQVWLEIDSAIGICNHIEADLNQRKSEMTSKLTEVTTVLREQTSYLTRLMDEVEPNITEVRVTLSEYQQVERALSPSSGLPHIYMVTFLNSLIKSVNTIIKSVWSYDLRLVPIDPNKPLDFSFPVKVYGKHVIKDTNICSDGQMGIINLAWSLALYKQLGLCDRYPMKLDEPDAALSEGHRLKLLELLSELVERNELHQLFIINHHAALHTGFANAHVLCLAEEGIMLPPVYNDHVEIQMA